MGRAGKETDLCGELWLLTWPYIHLCCLLHLTRVQPHLQESIPWCRRNKRKLKTHFILSSETASKESWRVTIPSRSQTIAMASSLPWWPQDFGDGCCFWLLQNSLCCQVSCDCSLALSDSCALCLVFLSRLPLVSQTIPLLIHWVPLLPPITEVMMAMHAPSNR